MEMNPLQANLPGRVIAQTGASLPGQAGLGGELFASLLGMQLEGDAGQSLGVPGRRKIAAAPDNDPQLLLYGTPQALPLPQLAVRHAPAAAPAGEADAAPAMAGAAPRGSADVLALVEDMVGVSQQAGGKKLPQNARQLLQFLPDGQLLAQGPAPVDAGRASAPVPLVIAAPLDAGARWQDEFATQMSGLIQLKAEGAKIQVNPAHLGPIEVSLKLGQDQAQLSFVTSTPQARDAVEQGLSRLSTMLAQSGIQLTDAQVSYGGGRQQQEQPARRHHVSADEETMMPLASVSQENDDRGLSIRA